MSNNVSRRKFLASSTALAALAGCMAAKPKAAAAAEQAPVSAASGIRVRFLGTGAAGWRPEWAKNPHARRQSSVLLENKVLIDFTMCSFDKLPADCHPEVLFQTHSHGDHYNPTAAVKSGVKRMYVQETWADAARAEVAQAAARLSLPAPEVIGLPFGKPVVACGMRFTGVPANHSTSRVTDGVLERTSVYLVEKTAQAGAVTYVHKPQALTAFIMEATDGDSDDDFRLFVHSSVQTVSRTVNMLVKHGRLKLPPGQHAYITHLGLKYRGWPAERIDKELPELLRAASDGLELVLG